MEVSLASSFVVVAVPLRLRRRRSEKSEIIDVSRFSAREEAYGGGRRCLEGNRERGM